MGAESDTEQPAAPAAAPGKINLKIRFPDGEELAVNVKQSTPFSKIYAAVAGSRGLDATNRTFSLSFGADRLNQTDNPKMHEMEDGDIIEFRENQIGGGVMTC